MCDGSKSVGPYEHFNLAPFGFTKNFLGVQALIQRKLGCAVIQM